MPFSFSEMTATVAKDPKAAASAFAEIVNAGGDCSAIAARYEVTLRTVVRWISRLRQALGADGLGFTLREGRKPGVPQGPRKASKSGRSKKKKRVAKKR